MLHIPHQEKVVPSGHRLDDPLLQGVYVLVFVHEYVLEAALVFRGDPGLLQKAQGQPLHVPVIHQSQLPLAGGISGLEIQQQLFEPGDMGLQFLEPGRVLGQGQGQLLAQLLQFPLQAVAGLDHRLLHGRVRAPGPGEPAKGHAL